MGRHIYWDIHKYFFTEFPIILYEWLAQLTYQKRKSQGGEPRSTLFINYFIVPKAHFGKMKFLFYSPLKPVLFPSMNLSREVFPIELPIEIFFLFMHLRVQITISFLHTFRSRNMCLTNSYSIYCIEKVHFTAQ